MGAGIVGMVPLIGASELGRRVDVEGHSCWTKNATWASDDRHCLIDDRWARGDGWARYEGWVIGRGDW
jgi:hypothetical protein